MKEIPLTKGFVALVDDEDFDYLNQWKWRALVIKNRKDLVYAINMKQIRISPGSKGRKKKLRMMHREILHVNQSKIIIDHINNNGLDNRKENLRICTNTENCRNAKKRVPGTSKYKGVTYRTNTTNKIWRSRIRVNNKLIDLGCYSTEEEAAQKYDIAAKYYFGEFARLNFDE